MWAATDFTKQNGATNVVPGSHLWALGPDGKRPAEGRRGGGLPANVQVSPAEMKMGSVLLYLGNTPVVWGDREEASRSGTLRKQGRLSET